MLIEYKIKAFCNLLISLGWELTAINDNKTPLAKLINRNLYEEDVDILISKNYYTPDFSRQLFATIEKAIQLDERIINQTQTQSLILFLKNYDRHFSKTKEHWIILEPESKYTENEIPYIYIP